MFYLDQISDFFKIHIFVPTLYEIFETGLSAQSHKQHGRHASAVSNYTHAEQKVSKQQLTKSFITLAIYSRCFTA